MQAGLKLGYYNPLALKSALPSGLFKIEQNWMCQLHGILQLPCSLIRIVVLPLHLYLSSGTISNSFLGSTTCLSYIRTPPSPGLHASVHTTKSLSWSWRILLLSFEHFQCLWKPAIRMLIPKAMSKFSCQIQSYRIPSLTRFSKS